MYTVCYGEDKVNVSVLSTWEGIVNILKDDQIDDRVKEITDKTGIYSSYDDSEYAGVTKILILKEGIWDNFSKNLT